MVVDKGQIYKCNVCGNVVEVLTVGDGELVCCGKPMELLVPKTEDVGKEKHVPVLSTEPHHDLVKVGAIAHPMEEKHYIEWIAVKTSDYKTGRKFLKPGDLPEAVFEIRGKKIKEIFAYCNVHGLWKTDVKQ